MCPESFVKVKYMEVGPIFLALIYQVLSAILENTIQGEFCRREVNASDA